MDVRDISGRPGTSPVALLAYAVALAALLLIPPYLRLQVGPPRWFTLQEAADLFTPLVVIPLAWVAFDSAGGLGRRGVVVFLVIAALWVEGQGIHLAANAIGDAYPIPAEQAAFYATDPGDLDHWLDEDLSHWMWHVAWVGLSVLLLAAGTRSLLQARPGAAGGSSRAAGVAGFIHGATFFIVTVEGVTTALGIPASIVFLGWAGLAARDRAGRTPVAVFFVVSSAATLLGYLVWGALHDWQLPEFCKAGFC